MANPHREFTADDSLSRDGTWIDDALSAEFGVRHEAGSALRSVWLDSADWRLWRAGLVLHQTGRGARSELNLDDLAGEPLLAEPVSTNWPSTIEPTPTSALRTRLAATLGIRALLPLAEVNTQRSQARLVDSEDKTVVHVTVEDARLIKPQARRLPLRIIFTAVRGYERELKRAADLLAAVSGVEIATQSARETALSAAGCPTGGQAGKVDLVLDGSAPAAQSVARILLVWLDTIEANLAGCRADLDTEFLHDVRIAVRQTRTVLKALGDVLPAGVAERFAPEWRWLGALTTPTRDLDVILLGLDGRSDAVDVSGLTGLEPLQSDLARQRRNELRRMRTGLGSARVAELLRDWRAALTEVGPAAVTGASTADIAGHRLVRAYRRVVKHAAAITPEAGAEPMHDLRKRCKELRYLLEAFGSIYDEKGRRRVVKDLKYLQDQLGEVQDSHIHRSMLTAFVHASTPSPAPAATVLAVGALIDRLDTRRHRAHRELPSALARLADARISAGLRPLAEAAA